jgi:hypothetical protein
MTARHIPAIVITGELDEEKKYILDRLEAYFQKEGYTTAIVPDMAAELLSRNHGPGIMGIVPFHACVLQLTLNSEASARYDLERADKPLIFVCRGAMDGVAWLTSEEIEDVWSHEGCTRVDLRDKRYNGVLHILASNPRVQAHDDRTLAAWIGAPHLACIGLNPSLDERVRQAIVWAASFISGVEHERRWFIKPSFDRSRLPSNARSIEIRQTYVRLPNELKDHRYRARGDDNTYLYIRTLKRKTGYMSSDDTDEIIHEHAFTGDISRYQTPGYATVVKDRVCAVGNLHYYEHDFLRDLQIQILEAEVPHPDYDVGLPPWIDPDDAREVTGQGGFSNRDFSRALADLKQVA